MKKKALWFYGTISYLMFIPNELLALNLSFPITKSTEFHFQLNSNTFQMEGDHAFPEVINQGHTYILGPSQCESNATYCAIKLGVTYNFI